MKKNINKKFNRFGQKREQKKVCKDYQNKNKKRAST